MGSKRRFICDGIFAATEPGRKNYRPATGALTLGELEKRAVLEALDANSGDRRRAAEQLGISLRTLQSRLKDYGLTRSAKS